MRLTTAILTTALALALAACSSKEQANPANSETASSATAPDGKQWVNVVRKTTEGGYEIGNPDAKIALVEYLSLTCSHCRDFEHEAYEELLRDYVGTGNVKFEIRNFLLNPYDIPLSILTRCSTDDAFLPLTQQFFQNQTSFLETLQKTPTEKMEAALKQPEQMRFFALAEAMGAVEFFKARGVTAEQAKQCLTDPERTKQLITMTEEGTAKYKVTGTPAFSINGAPIKLTAQTPLWQQVKAKLADAGAR